MKRSAGVAGFHAPLSTTGTKAKLGNPLRVAVYNGADDPGIQPESAKAFKAGALPPCPLLVTPAYLIDIQLTSFVGSWCLLCTMHSLLAAIWAHVLLRQVSQWVSGCGICFMVSWMMGICCTYSVAGGGGGGQCNLVLHSLWPDGARIHPHGEPAVEWQLQHGK